MAAVSTAPGLPSHSPLRTASYSNDDEHMSTIPDPRSRTMSPANGSPPSPSHHPDLSNEVATLSNKLINAINHQTNLDDTLSATRHELEAARERIRLLELEQDEHKNQIARGVLVKSSVVQAETSKLLASLTVEKVLREETEREKKRIEGELENLTTALFEEANKMVITAREEASREHELYQKRNDQLKAQLADTESLLKSHQEQLIELKQVMEQMSAERDDETNQTAPSTPGLSKYDSKDDIIESTEGGNLASGPGDVIPSYPTSFTHLLSPVLRTDLAAFDDFASLLHMSKIHAPSRVSSGSYGGLGLGLGLAMGNSAMSSALQQTPSNASTSSLNTPATVGSSPGTPTTPASSISAASMNGSNAMTPLKETKFYKRALAEDIEPTLRLDTAPGLSWLSRKSVLNAMCDGSLVVEPMATTSTAKLYVFACSLCGETRRDPEHMRTHRFRTSESETAQRYPLCKYCLGRVRSSCDFLGFLRMLKDGHWRTDGEESERAAWEESVRLREQMFWCRMGGGVVPTTHVHHHSSHAHDSKAPQLSEDERREQEELKKLSEELERTGEIKPRDITPVAEAIQPDVAGNEAFLAQRNEQQKRSVRGETTEGLRKSAQEDTKPSSPNMTSFKDSALGFSEHEEPSKRDSTPSTRSLSVEPESKKDEQRLSITIPGSFE
jgi:hypothetical protein